MIHSRWEGEGNTQKKLKTKKIGGYSSIPHERTDVCTKSVFYNAIPGTGFLAGIDPALGFIGLGPWGGPRIGPDAWLAELARGRFMSCEGEDIVRGGPEYGALLFDRARGGPFMCGGDIWRGAGDMRPLAGWRPGG